ncbi:hypothetical protein QWY79_12790 [Halomonas sabkhae]|uniref:hypothetical protein n=1 Tax=Halomonas sabkhae TaxID=626223 RepID=UPI0025B5166F|nr:hypothetical protein [Halomonas sabkhae]MDN3526142.1 hypothetical protein [Halomonas sabkhae]
MNSRADKWIATGLVMVVTGFSACVAVADDEPVFSQQSTRITQLDNGLIIEGQDVESGDRFTSGFSLTAGINPTTMPALDLGAEFSYRDSDAVPVSGQRLVDTTSLGGSLIAGIRLQDGFGLYAKSGLANWDTDGATGSTGLEENGTARVEGFGARWHNNGVISQLEYEHFDDTTLSHLNRINATVRVPF